MLENADRGDTGASTGGGKEEGQDNTGETLKEGRVDEPLVMQRRTLLWSRRSAFILRRQSRHGEMSDEGEDVQVSREAWGRRRGGKPRSERNVGDPSGEKGLTES